LKLSKISWRAVVRRLRAAAQWERPSGTDLLDQAGGGTQPDDEDSASGPLASALPWLTFDAIAFLAGQVGGHMRVFEYGSGGSTLFFAARAARVVSVEHDRLWSERVQSTLVERGCTNCELRLIEPAEAASLYDADPADPDAYASSDEAYGGQSFLGYASSIDQYPDHSFDVVLVDGRSRPSCVKHAAPKVTPGGFLVLDNAERPVYARAQEQMEEPEWIARDFHGLGPYARYEWLTRVFQRRG